jgi:hypothetical protein
MPQGSTTNSAHRSGCRWARLWWLPTESTSCSANELRWETMATEMRSNGAARKAERSSSTIRSHGYPSQMVDRVSVEGSLTQA